jgi:pilus assembly protein FimV
MFRKSALAIAMVGTFSAGTAFALGLGEIELKSALNQPLDAEVELLSATRQELQELKVEVASPEAFARAGIERPMFLNKLQFDIKTKTDGNPVLHISSREVVREPFLDFLLEVSWSKGRLVREYTVLVDPPVTMPAPAPALQAPAARSPVQQAPAAARQVTHAAELPPVPVAPTEYTTQRNDTLWQVAHRVRPDAGVSIEQTMLGLLRANPEAFIDNNINNLKAGYILRVPDREELIRMSQADARREARRQYAEWREARDLAAADASQVATQSTGPAAAGAPDASLELVAPELSEAGADGDSGESAPDLKKLQNELLIANEALEAQRRQSEEMATRMSVLEEQIQNMQRLIQLKDDQLASLQAQVGEELAEPREAGVAPGVSGDGSESTAADAVAPGAADADVPTPGEEMVAGADAPTADEQMMAGAAAPDEPMGQGGVPESIGGAETGDAHAGEVPRLAAVSEPDILDEELTATDAPGSDETVGAAADRGDGANAERLDAVAEADTSVEPAAGAEPAEPDTLASPGIVERLLANPLWLGAGAAMLALVAFLGLRRKRDRDSEFQESILQAAHEKSSAAQDADDERPSMGSTSAHANAAASSLLSEFAISDMGAMKTDGEADPLAEADVYLAYGRYQQAEDLIKDALQANPGHVELELKLLEVYMAAKNQAAFDGYAEGILGRLENDDALRDKIAEMGREVSPDNPLYQGGAVASDAERETDETEILAFGSGQAAATAEPADTVEAQEFDMGVGFALDDSEDEFKPGSAEFTPPELVPDEPQIPDAALEATMDSIEPDRIQVEDDNTLEFDLEGLDLGGDEEADLPGDGELADLDEVSTKLDLARAYLDMGDPEGARSILDEVIEEGSDDQRSEAEQILAKIA